MSENSNKPNVLFWVIGVLALIWNGMGVDAYLQQAYQTDRFYEMFKDSPELLNLAIDSPYWSTAIFAIAVFSSIFACILLLLRKKLAVTLFFIGLLAVLIQTINGLFITGETQYYTAFNYSMLLMIPLFAVFLYVYAKKTRANGWLS
ncbi:MAG: hypothetical protein JKY02_06105 [Flavobacteriaceae bacterium]|nr:hypothetical protein [Flavobacteriaceae bacterium]